MPAEQRLADYLAGAFTGDERAVFEAELAGEPLALRELVEQRRLDAALDAMLDANSERMEAAIMASVFGASDTEAEARVLAETVFAPPSRGGKAANRWLHDGLPAWAIGRWTKVAAAVVLPGVLLGSFMWLRPRMKPTGSNLPSAELAGMSRGSELLRELAPLVAKPPVWTVSEQQSAWLAALAAATAPGGNER